MKDRPVSDDEAFDALADWTVRFEEAQKAIENTSWGRAWRSLIAPCGEPRAMRAAQEGERL